MVQIKPILNAYIDANILLALAFVVWLAARYALNLIGYKRVYSVQLSVLNCVLLAVVAAPLLAIVVKSAAGWWMPGASVSVSDKVLALYLNGSFQQMKPSEFEALFGLRTALTDQLIYGPPAWLLGLACAVATGFVLSVARLGLHIARLHQLVRHAYLWRRRGSVDIRISDQIHIPFSTRGLRRRIIVIPSAMLVEPEHLRMSLAHEFQHLRNGDIEWELALELLRPLAFWNPVYLLWKREIERLRELSCDRTLLDRSRIDPRAYGMCLMDVCRRNVRSYSPNQIATPSVGFVGSLAGLKSRRTKRDLCERLTALITPAESHRGTRIHWMLAIPTVLSVTIMCLAIQRPADWSHDRLMLSTIVNLERLDALNAEANPFR